MTGLTTVRRGRLTHINDLARAELTFGTRYRGELTLAWREDIWRRLRVYALSRRTFRSSKSTGGFAVPRPAPTHGINLRRTADLESYLRYFFELSTSTTPGYYYSRSQDYKCSRVYIKTPGPRGLKICRCASSVEVFPPTTQLSAAPSSSRLRIFRTASSSPGVSVCEDRTLAASQTHDDDGYLDDISCSMASPYPAARPPVHWWDSVLHERASGVPIRWKDGLVGGTTDDGKWVITSPNASYVPRPMMGAIPIVLCGDGHYGAADPIHWPQILSHDTRFLWLAALHQQPSNLADPVALVWKVFSVVDFAPLPGVGVDLGIAKEACSQRITPCVEQTLESAQAVQTRNGVNRELQWPASSLEEAFDRLDIPASYCDIARQYACVQRYLLYTTAWLDWHVGVLRTYSADD
ncbi:hypothetical protein NM688_g5590 [Phlebia brevispora]|uniref:Uncharacterized protein n=1 Tax=Phlebia brevispora TaxID=194682 RepID=A0ACC1ST08_9APHY|nr:hypothetical protein NM688_g5590 [Phlebia brevispora]